MGNSTLALPPLALASGTQKAINHWLVGAAVVVPALMGVVGWTFVGVARPYIAGGLSAAAADDGWVMTTYLAANGFILPLTGWLSAHFGRRNFFLWSIAVFTIASVLCGMAASLPELILFRTIQGLSRRRAAGRKPGDPFGCLPAREARHGPDNVRHRRHGGSNRRSDSERLARHQLQLAAGSSTSTRRSGSSASWPATACWKTRIT